MVRELAQTQADFHTRMYAEFSSVRESAARIEVTVESLSSKLEDQAKEATRMDEVMRMLESNDTRRSERWRITKAVGAWLAGGIGLLATALTAAHLMGLIGSGAP